MNSKDRRHAARKKIRIKKGRPDPRHGRWDFSVQALISLDKRALFAYSR